MGKNNCPMLYDFGAARENNRGDFTRQLDTILAPGTSPWSAREIVSPFSIKGASYTKASDVWSFGMTIYVSSDTEPYNGLWANVFSRKSLQSVILSITWKEGVKTVDLRKTVWGVQP